MIAKRDRLPSPDDLVRAAEAHAAETGELGHAVGDLREVLLAAWAVMTPAQRSVLFARPELVGLAELPEFGPLLDRAAGRRPR